jgi:transcriptional regulator GlxA family with amidase domain
LNKTAAYCDPSSAEALAGQAYGRSEAARQVFGLALQIALKYLRTTRLANEDIALALGSSDAAIFRSPFRRATNKSLARSEVSRSDRADPHHST